MTSDPTLSMPLVSVVVNNYNYARYVCDALRSVAAQTYPHVEIIVVDDCSTDDSWSVIGAALVDDDRLKSARAYRLERNAGQTGACSHGLAHSSGRFVIFLDADDILFPRAIETHIYAHLSMRNNVGFSSVDLVMFEGDQIVAGKGSTSATTFIASGEGVKAEWIRAVDEIDGFWRCTGPAPLMPHQIHWLMPPYCDPWVWSSLSGHCFRREAVSLFLTGPLQGHATGTDGFLVRPIAALFGSVLLDKPMMGYRLHDKNAFMKRLPFARTHQFGEVQLKGIVALQKKSIDYMVGNSKKIISMCHSDTVFFEAVHRQCQAWPLLVCDAEYMETAFLKSGSADSDVKVAYQAWKIDQILEDEDAPPAPPIKSKNCFSLLSDKICGYRRPILTRRHKATRGS